MDSSLEQQLAAQQQQRLGEVRRKYLDLSGVATNTRNRTWLIRRIAWLIQAQKAGGLSERARERAEELACDADLRVNAPALAQGAKVQVELPTAATIPQEFDPRLPIPGSLLYREYKGRVYQVLVQQQGFEMDGGGGGSPKDSRPHVSQITPFLKKASTSCIPIDQRKMMPAIDNSL